MVKPITLEVGWNVGGPIPAEIDAHETNRASERGEAQTRGSMTGRLIVVPQGECVTSIAFRHGLLPKTIWEHPKNAALRLSRTDGNILHPGDMLFVPEVRERVESGATESRHAFRRTLGRAAFEVTLLRDGKPRADVAYTLTIDGSSITGVTDAQGTLRQSIHPHAIVAQLAMHDAPDEAPITVWLRHLCPIDEPMGAQQRLVSLGYYHGVPGDAWTEDARAALMLFQSDHHVTTSGALDVETRDELHSAYGS